MVDVCLIGMPFGSVRRPNIGVSLLKAGLRSISVSCKIHYFNVKFAERIGLELYDRLAETSLDSPLIGELIFSRFVFDRHQWKKESICKIITKIFAKKHHNVASIDKIVDEIVRVQELIPEFLDDCEYNVLTQKPKLIGFSSTFEQNGASLALAKHLKKSVNASVIFGGANCEGEMGATLLKCSPWLDFVCSGEGDIAFIEFVKNFFSDQPPRKIRGILTRESNPLDVAITNPVMDMDSLPTPDYDDFFNSFGHSQLIDGLEPELVIETSRGCWWGEKFQCTFCGLNGSTIRYRSKSISRVLEEILHLSRKYGINKFQVVDNILDLKYIRGLFTEIYNQNLGINLFYETKSNIAREQLLVMKQGGVDAIQPGIESLSDSILDIMKKGVTALQNIQLLKWCRGIGIVPLWNVIWGFPGEPKEEYEKMATLVPLLTHLHPPKGFGKLILDRFSPYFVDGRKYGIRNVRPWIAYEFLYPLKEEDLKRIAYHFDFDYSDTQDPDLYTKELESELIKWKKMWGLDNVDDPNGETVTPPSLGVVEGRDFVMIKDTRPCSTQHIHLLASERAHIYRICEIAHNFQAIYIKVQEEFPTITPDRLECLLKELLIKKIVIRDNGNYLSLGISVRS
jgi:ribosomal peptide maturation radical SAM protein 1